LDDAAAAFKRGDYSTVVRIIRPLADQGNAKAQHNLGIMYDSGVGVAKDYAEAVKWLRKAADQGRSDSQYNLGRMYQYGHGVPRNLTEAVKWYRKASEQGETVAQWRLGSAYLTGEGIGRNPVQACKWFILAAKGNPESRDMSTFGIACREGDPKMDMSPEQFAEAQKLAREWRPKKN
jgi:TPR repeat protein